MSGGHTPGPWAWLGNAKNNEVYLATDHSGRRYVMGFRRWGMRSAQPVFQPGKQGLVAAEKLLAFEVGDRNVRGIEQAKADESVYRYDISGIDCADARLIAAAPCLLGALVEAEKHFGPFAEITVNGEHDVDDVRVISLIRAAIAKATGAA